MFIGALLAVDIFTDDHLFKLLYLFIGVLFVFSASAALNHVFEVNVDQLMERTKDRPLVTRRFSIFWVVILAVLSAFLGLLILYFFVNYFVFLVALGILCLYNFFYTPLKKISWLNTFVGAFPGAMPFLCGWYAFSSDFTIIALLYFLLFYFWQLPHFFAIAWIAKDSYQSAGIRMVSYKDDQGLFTCRVLAVSSVLFVIISLLPFVYNFAGYVYLFSMGLLGFYLLKYSYYFLFDRSIELARTIMKLSILYPPVLFLVILIERRYLLIDLFF